MVATFEQIGEQTGVGQWFRYLTGAIEIGAVALLWIPGRQVFGAVLLGATMAGAIIAHLTVLGPSAVPAAASTTSSNAATYDQAKTRRPVTSITGRSPIASSITSSIKKLQTRYDPATPPSVLSRLAASAAGAEPLYFLIHNEYCFRALSTCLSCR